MSKTKVYYNAHYLMPFYVPGIQLALLSQYHVNAADLESVVYYNANLWTVGSDLRIPSLESKKPFFDMVADFIDGLKNSGEKTAVPSGVRGICDAIPYLIQNNIETKMPIENLSALILHTDSGFIDLLPSGIINHCGTIESALYFLRDKLYDNTMYDRMCTGRVSQNMIANRKIGFGNNNIPVEELVKIEYAISKRNPMYKGHYKKNKNIIKGLLIETVNNVQR